MFNPFSGRSESLAGASPTGGTVGDMTGETTARRPPAPPERPPEPRRNPGETLSAEGRNGAEAVARVRRPTG